jgi:hypothetical protein
MRNAWASRNFKYSLSSSLERKVGGVGNVELLCLSFIITALVPVLSELEFAMCARRYRGRTEVVSNKSARILPFVGHSVLAYSVN